METWTSPKMKPEGWALGLSSQLSSRSAPSLRDFLYELGRPDCLALIPSIDPPLFDTSGLLLRALRAGFLKSTPYPREALRRTFEPGWQSEDCIEIPDSEADRRILRTSLGREAV